MEILKFHWSVIYNNREDDHVYEGFLLEGIIRWCYSFSEARMSLKSQHSLSSPSQDKISMTGEEEARDDRTSMTSN